MVTLLLLISVMIAIFAMLALSLNLLAGYSGVFSVAHAALWGIGSFTAALSALKLQWPFIPASIAAAVAAAIAGLFIGFIALRVHGNYFFLASFAVQQIVMDITLNAADITGGPLGIKAIPRANILGITLDRASYAWLGLAMVLITLGIVTLVVRSPYGRVLKVIREDEAVAAVHGKNVAFYKVSVFGLAGLIAGLAGSLYAHFVGFISAYTFSLSESIVILSLVLVGGAGSIFGPLLGAVVLVSIPEVLNLLDVSPDVAGPIRQSIFAGVLVLFVALRPDGLASFFSKGKQRKARAAGQAWTPAGTAEPT